MDSAEDYVIATGKSHSFGLFTEMAFSCFDLDWRNHLEAQADLFRPTDIAENHANPQRAVVILGWRAKHDVRDVISSWQIESISVNGQRG